MLYEQVMAGMYAYSSKAILAVAPAALNAELKGCQEVNSTFGQASVYGTHFVDFFMATTYGRLLLCFNEPTTETTSQFTMVSGTAKFNSSGGLLMPVVGDQCIWEMPYFAKGHTGFVNTAAVMYGETISRYTLEFQADTGTGYSGSWSTLDGTNLSALTVSPTVGFKLKIRITTVTANAAAITYLRLDTTTTAAAQSADLYPLDVITTTLTGLVAGSDVVVLSHGTETVLATVEDNSATSWSFTYETAETVDIAIYKPGYFPLTTIHNFMLGAADASIPVVQVLDPSYLE
jgi:hypothetical protein